jgi:hypothetical protein
VWGQQELRQHLKAKLGIGDRQLQRLIARRAKELPSTSEEALWSLAHEHDLLLQNYLTPEQIARVRGLRSGGSSPQRSSPAPARALPRSRPAASHPRPTSAEIALGKIKIPGGLLSERHRKDAERMAIDVYPLLYAFENSVREFIDGHLIAAYGANWYDDPKIVSTDVRRTVERNRKADTENRTHSARNARPIYYTTFGELILIVQSKKGSQVFRRPLFPRVTWFPELVKASEHTRNIVAHMNPIQPQDLKRLQVDFEDWLNQTKGHVPPTVP